MKKALLILVILFTGFSNLKASHIPGGNLTWQCTGNPNEYIVRMVMFVSCPNTLGTQYNITITNTCGYPVMNEALAQVGVMQEVSQICPADMWNSACATPAGTIPGVRMYTYEATITLPGPCNTWDFAFELCCRDQNSNTAGGNGNDMYFHSGMNSATAPCDNSPYVTAQPIPYVCAGVQQTYCPGAIDPDGDLLTYTLVSPLGGGGTPIAYNAPYTIASPLQNLTIDPITGCITFNQPTTGNFVVTYLIEAWDAMGNLTGFIYHDFQFEVINNANCQPPLAPNATGLTNVTGAATVLNLNALQICEGESLCFDVVFTDPDAGDTLRLDSANTNLFAALPGATITQAGINPTTFTICWTVPVGQSPNTTFTIGVTDGSCPIENLASYPVSIAVINSTVVPTDMTRCLGQPANLTGNGGTIFNWSVVSGPPMVVGTNFSCNPCANPVATPTATTTYAVVSNLAAGCNNTDTVTVTIVPDFTPTLTQTAASTCLYDPVQLDITINPAGPGYSYLWTPATFLDSDTIPNPLAVITTPGSYTYYVDITSPGGCVKTDSITVTITNNVAPTFTISADSLITCGQQSQFSLVLDTLNFAGAIDDFNGVLSANWQSVTGVANTDCGSVTGNALHFDNTTTREAVTVPQNVMSCTSVDFCLFIGNNGSGGAPCENADATEDVELQYSITGVGGPWITMQIFDDADWDTGGPYANAWECFTIAIPAAAQTATTLFKWVQPNFSACTGCDNWALDDVSITCPAPTNNYSYLWTPGATLNDDTIQNPIGSPLVNTTYYVTVTDPNGGCTSSDSLTILVVCDSCDPVGALVTNVTCKNGSDGAITAFPNFDIMSEVQTLTWIDSISGAILQVTPNLTIGMTDSLVNIPAGAYTISMQDSSGCIADTTVWITEPDSVIIPTLTADHIICIGGTSQVDATASGGNGGPFNYFWTDLSTGTPLAGPAPFVVNPVISPTCYSVYALDTLGCTSDTQQVCVDLYPNIIASTSNGTHYDTITYCPTIPSGLLGVDLEMNAIGGIGAPYTYTWYQNNIAVGVGASFNVTPMTSPMTFIGVASDTCSTPHDSVWVTVLIDCPCYPVIPTITNASCDNGSDGIIYITPTFGLTSEIQTITWIDSLTGAILQVTPNLTVGMTDSLTGLSAGAYTISMQDTSGCISDTTIWITEPSPVTIATITTDDIVCIGGSIQIDATAIGGNGGPFTYNWTDLSTGGIIAGIPPITVSPIVSPTCYAAYALDILGCISDTQQVCMDLHPNIIANTLNGTPYETITVCPASAIGGPFSATLSMTAVGGMGTPYIYTWYENNNQIGVGNYFIVNPTVSPTTYIGVATDNCTTPGDSVWVTVNWFDVITPDFEKNKPDSCFPIDLIFTDISTPINLIGNSEWAFSDGTTDTGNPVSKTFNNAVCQDVTLTTTSTDGCAFSVTKVDYVCPLDYPIADFYMTPPITDVLNTEIHFTNLSIGNNLSYLWNFNSGLTPDTSNLSDPTFTYPNIAPGTYPVVLTVKSNPGGCESTAYGTVVINGIYLFYVPNSFTPDNDGINDLFFATGKDIDIENYTMQIYDRWGIMLFETNDIKKGWDGTYKGKAVPADVYVWKIVSKEKYSPIIHEDVGHVNLIK